MKTGNIKIKLAGLVLLTGFSIYTSTAQEKRIVGDFNGIKAGDSFNIILSQSDSNTVKVEADEKSQLQIKTEIKDGILSIIAIDNIKSDKPLVINIGIKSLSNLDITGAADVKSDNQLICDKLTIASNGAGKIHLDIKASDVKTKISGAGNVILMGTAQMLEATLSGAGNLKASNLEVDKAKVKVSGAGDAKINVKQNLEADVSGAGSVIYKGNPISKKDSLSNYNEEFKHWTGFEIGVNGLLDYKNSLDAPKGAAFIELNYARSIHFGLNLLEKNFHIYKNYVNLVTGFGFDFKHYALKNNVTLNSDATYLDASNDAVKYKKNTLNVSYIKAPLMLEFNTGKKSNHNFHVAVGAQFEYRIHSVLKQKYDLNDKHNKIKQRDDFNLEPFLYTATARIGYNKVTLFANYGLNRLFKKDKGPQVYPFTAGVNFNF
ncbi:MAG: DUF2807 domain-containing protein [Bacteroidetes bacterium]|nr:DUF2807 domain-containing protein [Bacteroidota bacterium]